MRSRTTILLIIAVFAAVGLWFDAVVLDATARAERRAEPAEPVALDVADRDSARRGSAYCVPLAEQGEGARLTLSSVDGDAQAVVSVGEETLEQLTVAPSATVDVPPELADQPVTIRWNQAPVVAVYATTGQGSQAVQRCVPRTQPRWHIAGFDTTLGNNATLHLYNPFSVDAVARVGFATPDGAVDLVTTQDVAVPAGEAIALDLDEVQPEVADLGVVVDVLTGRLVAAGQMHFGPPDDDTPAPSGRTALEGVGAPATELRFAYGAAQQDAGLQTWLSLMNPDPDREALVVIDVSAPDPTVSGEQEVVVPPGGTVRVDAAGLSERRTFGSAISVINDVPVVATRYAVRQTDGASAVDAASAVPASEDWLVLGDGTQNRVSTVDVYNFGSETVAVTVEPLVAGIDTPDQWRGVPIEANGQRGFALLDLFALLDPGDDLLGEDLDLSAVRVRADAPVVASVRSADVASGPAGFWTLGGFTSSTWGGVPSRPHLLYAPTLDRQPLPAATTTTEP